MIFANNKILAFVFLLITQTVFGQMQLKLTVEMPNCKNEQFLLLQGDEGGTFVIDKADVSENGILSFSWEGNYGFYRLLGENGKIDFMISTPDFYFSLEGKPEGGVLRFADNDKNNQFHYYLSVFEALNR
ncbi:MAG: hypothetical protein ACERKZ_22135, partial [Lachnotalea sp.]